MNGDDLERLFDSKAAVDSVSNRDLRWMLVFVREQVKTGLGDLQKAIAAQDSNAKVLAEQVRANTVAVSKVQQAHEDCPLSDEEGRDRFVSDVIKAAVTEAVKEANGTKAVLGPLNRTEIFQVFGWVIMALVVGLIYLATNGAVQVPLP